jgi:hypothetical protein
MFKDTDVHIAANNEEQYEICVIGYMHESGRGYKEEGYGETPAD